MLTITSILPSTRETKMAGNQTERGASGVLGGAGWGVVVGCHHGEDEYEMCGDTARQIEAGSLQN